MTSRSRGTRRPSNHTIPSTTTASLGIGASNRIRPLLSEALAGRLISVEEPSRLLESAHGSRQVRFQALIRRYISQIQYGCEDSFCTTPTCLTCRKRDTSKPFKTPTQVTARALAHYLASQDNPDAGLCPNKLKVLPSALEIGGKKTDWGYGESPHSPGGSSVPGSNHALGHESNTSGNMQRNTASPYADSDSHTLYSQSSGYPNDSLDTLWQEIDQQHQAKKDNKSLGQNLFDTVAVIFSYSKHIPSPLESFRSSSKSREVIPLPLQNQKSQAGPGAQAAISDVVRPINVSLESGSVAAPDPKHLSNGHPDANGVNGDDTWPAQAAPQTLLLPGRHGSKNSHRCSISRVTTEYNSDGQIIRKITQRIPHKGNGLAKANEITALDGAGGNGFTKRNAMGKAKFPTGKPLRNGGTQDVSEAAPKPRPTPRNLENPTQHRGRAKVALPVTSHLTCDVMDELASHTHDYRSKTGGVSAFSFVVDYDKRTRARPTIPFVNRSLYFSLSDPATLLRSFRDEQWKQGAQSPLPHLNPKRLSHAFRSWSQRNGSLIFDSLWIATEVLFTPPPEMKPQKSPRLRAAQKAPSTDGFAELAVSPGPDDTPNPDKQQIYLSDLDAAHIVMICVHALTSLVPIGWPHTWAEIRNLRSWGVILPRAPTEDHQDAQYQFKHPWLGIIDELEYEPALRLVDRLVRGIAARRCFSEILKTLSRQANEQQDHKESEFGLMDIITQHLTVVEQQASKSRLNLDTGRDPGWTVTSVFMEWLRTLVIKQWDCRTEVHRWSAVGGAIEILGDFYEQRESLNLYSNMFHIHHLHERMDQVHAPSEWLTRSFNPNMLHLLSYPFLFHPQRIVSFFRTLNYASMYKQFERAERTQHLRRQLHMFFNEGYWYVIEDRLRVLFSRFLVLDVSRADPLKDTFDQLWGLEKRTFLKPLKVKLGHREGEQGLDQGGVSLEFFQVILAEIFDPDKGMFTVDPNNRMTWFTPGSLEPLYRYELIGILFSLAIYNGITLPVTFPTALYRRLLDKPVTSISHIRDGWPELAKGFDELLDWSDGDVGDVFTRTYSFSFKANGQRVDIDMEKAVFKSEDRTEGSSTARPATKRWPGGPWQDASGSQSTYTTVDEDDRLIPDERDEAELVTNANRDRFVADYIYFLTDRSIRSPFAAFAKGFYTCLDRKAVALFNEDALKFLVEGHHDIDIAALRVATKYEDGYTATHPTMLAFWDLVQTFGLDDKKRLLEFVTASDRVPVGGAAKMQFSIVRSAAPTDMLPTSSTCFGRLLLPEYETREKLEKKLRLALENSRGFGAI